MNLRTRQIFLILITESACLLSAQIPILENGDPGIVDHAECAFFTGKREQIAQGGMNGSPKMLTHIGNLTMEVAGRLGGSQEFIPGGSRTGGLQQNPLAGLGAIDRNLFGAMMQAGVTPADRTNDFEFIRRVTLDLTGRIPDPARVQSFVADSRSNKRDLLIDELLAKPEWVDKWTMFYGDLFNNTTRTSQVVRYGPGTSAFYQWIYDSLKSNKPYNQMATELITSTGTDSYNQGDLNFLVGGLVTGGPHQDIWDSQTVLTATTFLGISHLNCLLCHNGRGHLDTLSVWGSHQLRSQAWGMSAFMAKTLTSNIRVNPATVTPQYWALAEDPARFKTDYPLNTTTGNRPARQPLAAQTTVPPVYLFSGRGPKPGENYRVAFAREVTTDFQFARATVNYIWAQFYGKGIVEPVDAFDPDRQDPANPPPAGWAIQPTNPQLLTDLAQDFINSNYDLKALMREIVTSNAYQLSSRYNGTWNPAWENLFARKLVRRLWAEELHDAVAQTSGLLPSYNLQATFPHSSATESWAMKFPDTAGTPDNGPIARFLDSFWRGNRDDQNRLSDGSISQGLDLMNDPIIMTRIRGTSSTQVTGSAGLLLVKNLALSDDQLINTLFLNVLSRYPSAAEMTAAQAQLKTGTRTAAAEDLLWSLYNKVDFTFNY